MDKKSEAAALAGMNSFEGSLDCDLKLITGAPLDAATDQAKDRPDVDATPSHETREATELMEMSAVRAKVLRGRPGIVTDGTWLSMTVIRHVPVPQRFRKLHMVTAKLTLYEAPLAKSLFGMAGATAEVFKLLTKTVFMKALSADTFCEGLLTTTTTDSQARPPVPVELETSTVGETQRPTVEGAEMETVGTRALAGRDRVTLTLDVALPHDPHKDGV